MMDNRYFMTLAVVFFLSISVLSYSFYIQGSNVEGKSNTLTVVGSSMVPTFASGNTVSVDYTYYEDTPITRGDIVALQLFPDKPPLVKRVVAVPGDQVAITDGVLLVNGARDSHASLSPGFSFSESNSNVLMIQLSWGGGVIPPQMYILLGDNRLDSLDSTEVGRFKEYQIIGKIIE